MDDLQSVVYQKEVIEFVAVAKEYCDFVETIPSMERKDVFGRLQKFIPLLYLKGSLLPACEVEGEGLTEDVVSEEQYNYLFEALRRLFGEYDEYLEVFDEHMQYSEAPVIHSIAEKCCDIYQDLKNFMNSYRNGFVEVMEEALWKLNDNFELYWGKSCAGVLRALHQVVYKVADADDEKGFTYNDQESLDLF